MNRNNEIAKIDSVHCIGKLDQFTYIGPPGNTTLWTFGDGNTSNSQNPNHAYNQSGNFSG